MKVLVNVSFTGVVEVEIPDSVKSGRRRPLAEKMALCKVLATTENPDSPDEEALDEYWEDFDLDRNMAEADWDASQVVGVNGVWVTKNEQEQEQEQE